MGHDRPPKKTETIEVRLAYETKRDFMAACDERSRTASAVLRDFIDHYIANATRVSHIRSVKELHMRFLASGTRARSAVALSATGVCLTAGLLVATASSAADQRLKAVFEWFDADHDGALTRQEFLEPAKQDTPSIHGIGVVVTTMDLPVNPEQESRSDMFTRLDTDRDGSLSFDEIAHAVRVDTVVNKSILAADNNGDGAVTAAELAAYMTAERAASGARSPQAGAALMALAIITEHDRDGDGAVEPSDFQD